MMPTAVLAIIHGARGLDLDIVDKPPRKKLVKSSPTTWVTIAVMLRGPAKKIVPLLKGMGMTQLPTAMPRPAAMPRLVRSSWERPAPLSARRAKESCDAKHFGTGLKGAVNLLIVIAGPFYHGLLILCLLWLAVPALAEESPEPPAPRVATESSTLWAAATAANETGEFVIGWFEPRSPSTPGLTQGYFGQRFSPAGRLVGEAFPLSVPSPLAGRPALSFISATRFVAVLTRSSHRGEAELVARVFDLEGSPRGGWFRIDQPSLNPSPFFPQAVADSGGGLTVVWQTGESGVWRVWGRRVLHDGAPITEPFPISEQLASQPEPVLAVAGDGDLVVIWARGTESLMGRVFGPDGEDRREKFVITDRSSVSPGSYDVAAIGDGRFLAAWLDRAGPGEGKARQLFGQWFDPTGLPLGESFTIAKKTEPLSAPLDHASVAVAADSLGGFLVTWLGRRPDGTEGLFGRFFDAETGLPLDSEFRLSEFGADSDGERSLRNTSLTFHPEVGYFSTWLESSLGENQRGWVWAGWLERPIPPASPLTSEEVACEGDRLRLALERLQILRTGSG